MRKAFVAGNHLCWFSNDYKDKTVNEVLKENPEYIAWCRDNLKHLKWATGLKNRIKRTQNENSK